MMKQVSGDGIVYDNETMKKELRLILEVGNTRYLFLKVQLPKKKSSFPGLVGQSVGYGSGFGVVKILSDNSVY
jgi:hypothetical protein